MYLSFVPSLHCYGYSYVNCYVVNISFVYQKFPTINKKEEICNQRLGYNVTAGIVKEGR